MLVQARERCPKDFKDTLKDRHKNPINTFSGMVIHLATAKNLLKDKKDLDRSSIESEIESIDTRLAKLKAVACSVEVVPYPCPMSKLISCRVCKCGHAC